MLARVLVAVVKRDSLDEIAFVLQFSVPRVFVDRLYLGQLSGALRREHTEILALLLNLQLSSTFHSLTTV